MDKTVIKRAADVVGGVVMLGHLLGLSRGAVSQWDRVPPQHVLRIEQLTGVSRYTLRPDIFGLAPIERESA